MYPSHSLWHALTMDEKEEYLGLQYESGAEGGEARLRELEELARKRITDGIQGA